MKLLLCLLAISLRATLSPASAAANNTSPSLPHKVQCYSAAGSLIANLPRGFVVEPPASVVFEARGGDGNVLFSLVVPLLDQGLISRVVVYPSQAGTLMG